MSTVLLLATRYDRSSLYTYGWAEALQQDLLQQGHTCILLDGTMICLGGSSLADAIGSADMVVYYGHATVDEWLALPNPPGTPPPQRIALMHAGLLHLFAGKPVYAGCCHSVSGLGIAYGNQFPHAGYPGAGYIGYDNSFGFDFASERHFKDVVNLSVSSLVNGDSPTKVVADLKQAWANLRDDFYKGRLQHVPNASMAGYLADENARRVDQQP